MSGVVVPKCANFMLAPYHGPLPAAGNEGRERPPSVAGLDFLANAERAADFAPSRSSEPYTAANRLLGRPTLVWLVASARNAEPVACARVGDLRGELSWGHDCDIGGHGGLYAG